MRFISVLAVISLLLTFASCSNGYMTDNKPLYTLSIPETPIPTADKNKPEDARGNIKMGVCSLDTLCPLETQNEAVSKYMTLVYESLVSPGKDALPEPLIASEWSTQDGGASWRFKLREDVYFHDGAQLTAYDVKNTLEWINKNGGTYKACADGITEVNIISRHELEIKCVSYDAFIPCKMIFPIIKSEDIGNFTVPNGTGKYKFESAADNIYKFILNENYYGDIPSIASFELQSFESQEEMYRSGADVMMFFEDNAVKYSTLEGYTSCEYADNVFTCLLPSSRTGTSLRHYLNSLLDRRNIMNAVIAGKGTEKLAPAASGTFYRIKSDEFALDDGSYDKPTEELVFIVNSADRDLVRLSLVLKRILNEAGVLCTVNEYKDEEYGAAVLAGNFDFALMNLQIDAWPDMYDLFSSKGRLNYNGYEDASMDSLLMSLRNACNQSAAGDVYGDSSFTDYMRAQTDKVCLRAAETLPIIGLYSKNALVLVKQSVSGLQQHNFTFWNTLSQFGSWRIEQ